MCCRALLVTWAFKQYSHECRKVQSNWEIRTACCMQVINLYPGKLCSWEKLYRVTVGKQLNIHPRVAERSKELRLGMEKYWEETAWIVPIFSPGSGQSSSCWCSWQHVENLETGQQKVLKDKAEELIYHEMHTDHKLLLLQGADWRNRSFALKYTCLSFLCTTYLYPIFGYWNWDNSD